MAIRDAYEFIWESVQTDQAGLSRVDTLCLAHGFGLSIPVVTDDESMLRTAETFQMEVMRSLDLLKLMLDRGHIEITKVREVVAYSPIVGLPNFSLACAGPFVTCGGGSRAPPNSGSIGFVLNPGKHPMIAFLLWLLLLVVCWPLAIVALVLYPIVWLLLLPFRLLGLAVNGVFEFLKAVLLLPARVLRGSH
jgi:hypothetical protein